MAEIGKSCQKYLTTRQVAEYFGVSTQTVRMWGLYGKLKIKEFYSEGYSPIIRVDRESVEKFEASSKTYGKQKE